MKRASISQYQTYIRQVVGERGFEKETPRQVFGLLVEEVGELSKALRKMEGMKTGVHSKTHDIAEEAADVLFLLLDFCNRTGIDLEAAFFRKEEKNKRRRMS